MDRQQTEWTKKRDNHYQQQQQQRIRITYDYVYRLYK